MNLIAVSNIAWSADADDAMAEALRDAGVGAVELAPGTRWSSVPEATVADARAWRDEWARRGMRPVAMQALLFGRPDLHLLGDAEARARSVDYLAHVMRLAASLGAGPLVFGSPANRRVGDLDPRTATARARETFAALGRCAAAAGVTLCIEPNPPQYHCDFLTNTREAVDFLASLSTPGLGLHLDAGALILNEEDADEAVARAMPFLRHFHVSEPFLTPVGASDDTAARHAAIAAALRRHHYAGVVSIEMRRPSDDAATAREAVTRAVLFAQQTYLR